MKGRAVVQMYRARERYTHHVLPHPVAGAMIGAAVAGLVNLVTRAAAAWRRHRNGVQL